MASIKRVPTERTRQVSRNVAAIRRNLGLSLAQFGAIANVSYQTVKNWEDEELTSEPNVSEYELLLEAQRKTNSGAGFAQFTVKFFLKLFGQLSRDDKSEVMEALQAQERDQ